MDALSPTAYVILGLVSETPRSGYEIKAVVDGTTRFFWAASYGQIYPELRRLAEAGLVAGTDRPSGGRKRIEYAITDEGLRYLQEWLRRPPETFELRDEGLLKLFFAGALPQREAKSTLAAMRERHEAVRAELRAKEPEAAEAGGFPLMVLQGGIEYSGFFIDWCRRMEERIDV